MQPMHSKIKRSNHELCKAKTGRCLLHSQNARRINMAKFDQEIGIASPERCLQSLSSSELSPSCSLHSYLLEPKFNFRMLKFRSNSQAALLPAKITYSKIADFADTDIQCTQATRPEHETHQQTKQTRPELLPYKARTVHYRIFSPTA